MSKNIILCFDGTCNNPEDALQHNTLNGNVEDDSITNILKLQPASDVVFENRSISPLVKEALHLLCVDDRRIAFFPTLINQDDRVTEIWFAGAHSDIGGGYRYDGLSDNTLQFMIDELKRRDLGIFLLTPKEVACNDLMEGDHEPIGYDDLPIGDQS